MKKKTFPKRRRGCNAQANAQAARGRGVPSLNLGLVQLRLAEVDVHLGARRVIPHPRASRGHSTRTRINFRITRLQSHACRQSKPPFLLLCTWLLPSICMARRIAKRLRKSSSVLALARLRLPLKAAW